MSDVSVDESAVDEWLAAVAEPDVEVAEAEVEPEADPETENVVFTGDFSDPEAPEPALEGVEDLSPQEQLEAYRAAGYPDSMLDVVSGNAGQILRVSPLAGPQLH